MTGYIRLKTTIPHDSGVPADAIVLTTHWVHVADGDSPLEVEASARTNMTAFLTSVKDLVSSHYNMGQIQHKTFNMLDPEPRIPLTTATAVITPTGAVTNDFPAELAVVISFQGTPMSGTNQRRRRGRIYLGPLSFALTAGADYWLVPTAWVDSLAQAAWEKFVIPTPTKGVLAVYSSYTAKQIPVGGTPTEDDEEVPELIPGSFTKVTQVWVDNAWDVQRRRGLKATYRKGYA